MEAKLGGGCKELCFRTSTTMHILIKLPISRKIKEEISKLIIFGLISDQTSGYLGWVRAILDITHIKAANKPNEN